MGLTTRVYSIWIAEKVQEKRSGYVLAAQICPWDGISEIIFCVLCDCKIINKSYFIVNQAWFCKVYKIIIMAALIIVTYM